MACCRATAVGGRVVIMGGQGTGDKAWSLKEVKILLHASLPLSLTQDRMALVLCYKSLKLDASHVVAATGHLLLLVSVDATREGVAVGEKRKEKTTPFGVNSMRSQVLYRAAQVQ